MKPSTQPINQSQQNSLNFDDNYNEEECLQQNNHIQKLSIMDDFNQLCLKLNHPPQQITETPPQNTLAHYYAELVQKKQSQESKIDSKTPLTNNFTNNYSDKTSNDPLYQKINKSTPLQSHYPRSCSSDIPNTQQNNPLQPLKHERNPSQGEAFKKKIIQQMQINDSKRNYSSVEDKKKILQPTKNISNNHQNLSMKDYYGDQKNIILKKQTIKNMIHKQPKSQKQTILNSFNSQTKQTHSHKLNKQNNLRQSNKINQSNKHQTFETQKTSKVSNVNQNEKKYRPQIVLFSRRINLSEDPDKLRAMLREEQIKSDYDMSNISVSSIDEGLFGNAIERQRNAKTPQTVQSPHIQINVSLPNRKEQGNNHQKQYISSPINISHSPNPTNVPKSLFQKRQIYRC